MAEPVEAVPVDKPRELIFANTPMSIFIPLSVSPLTLGERTYETDLSFLKSSLPLPREGSGWGQIFS